MKKLLLATLVVSVFALTNLAEAKCNDGSCHREKSSCHSGSCGKGSPCDEKNTIEEEEEPCCIKYVPARVKPVKHTTVRYSCPKGTESKAKVHDNSVLDAEEQPAAEMKKETKSKKAKKSKKDL